MNVGGVLEMVAIVLSKLRTNLMSIFIDASDTAGISIHC